MAYRGKVTGNPRKNTMRLSYSGDIEGSDQYIYSHPLVDHVEQEEMIPFIKTAVELSDFWALGGDINTYKLTPRARSFLNFDSTLRFRDEDNPMEIKKGSFDIYRDEPGYQKYMTAFNLVEAEEPESEGVDLSVDDIESMIGQLDHYLDLATSDNPYVRRSAPNALWPSTRKFIDLYMTLNDGMDIWDSVYYDSSSPGIFRLTPEERLFADVYYKYREKGMKTMRENENEERMRKTRQQEELKRRINKKEREILYKKSVNNIKNIIALFDSYYQEYPNAELVDHDYITKDAVKYINIDNYLRYHKNGKRSYGLKNHERFYEKVYNKVKNEKTQKDKTQKDKTQEDKPVYLPDKMEDIDPTPEELLEELLEESTSSRYFGEISTRTLPIVNKIIQFCVKKKFTLYDLDQILAYFLTSIPADYSEPSVTATCAIVMGKGESHGVKFLKYIKKSKILNRVKQICNKYIVDEPERTIYKCGGDYIWLIDFSWYTKSATSTRSICDYIDKIKTSKNAFVFTDIITDKIGTKITKILKRFVTFFRPDKISKLPKTPRKSVVKPLEIPIRPVKVEEPDSLFSDEEFWEERGGKNGFDFQLDGALASLRKKGVLEIPSELRNIKYHKKPRGETPNDLPPTIYSDDRDDLPPTIYSDDRGVLEIPSELRNIKYHKKPKGETPNDLPPTIYSDGGDLPPTIYSDDRGDLPPTIYSDDRGDLPPTIYSDRSLPQGLLGSSQRSRSLSLEI